MAAPTESDAKDRILDAAERLFHDRGFDGSSLRAVTADASVNVAAVHYYFGSKRALLGAVIERRAAPINAERLEQLGRLLAATPGEPPSVEAILDIFLRPVLEGNLAREIRDVSALLFREPIELVMPLVGTIFAEISERFVAALARSLPHLERDEVAERFHFVMGVTAQIAAGRHAVAMDLLRPDAPRPRQAELFASVLAFAAAGLRAPSTRATGGSE